MRALYIFLILFCGPPGWIIAAIIYFARKSSADQQRNRETMIEAAYISSGRTPPAKPEPGIDMSHWSDKDRAAYLAKNRQPANEPTGLDLAHARHLRREGRSQ